MNSGTPSSSAPAQPPQGAFKRPKWRWRILIYPKFQLTLIFANGLLTAVVLGIVAMQQSRSRAQLAQMGANAQLPSTHPYFQLLEMQYAHVWSQLLIAFTAAILLSSLATLYISARLAGPILRLKGYFRQIAETGAAPRDLNFRKGDYFSELPALINAALKKLQGR